MDSNHDFSHFTIAVIGLGLMGGSFAKRFKAIGSRVIGINRTASVAQEALRMGIVDSISEEDLKDADIVISSVSEKSLSFAIRWSMFGNAQTGNLLSKEPSGIAPFRHPERREASYVR